MSGPIVRSLDEQTIQLRAALLPDDRVLRFPYHDQEIAFYLPYAGTDYLQRLLLSGKFYEIEILEDLRARYSLKGATVVDAGANIGNHSIYFGAIMRVAKCHAFEPNKNTARMLRKNIKLNALDDIVDVREQGLAAKPGRARIESVIEGNVGGNAYAIDDAGEAEVTSIDHAGIDRIDFLKVDVEGMAAAVVQGASETLLRSGLPPVFVELQGDELQTGDAALRHLGYSPAKSYSKKNVLYERTR